MTKVCTRCGREKICKDVTIDGQLAVRTIFTRRQGGFLGLAPERTTYLKPEGTAGCRDDEVKRRVPETQGKFQERSVCRLSDR